MSLSEQLISQFAKTMVANGSSKNVADTTTKYGKTVIYNGRKYVQLDGSELLTPIETTVSVKDGDRVTVKIENHSAIITGNLSDPAASGETVTSMGSQISEFEIIIADKVSVDQLIAEVARIDQLVAEDVTIKGELKAANANIESLQADNVQITGKLEAAEANIKKLDAEKVSAEFLEANYAEINDLNATNANIHNLQVDYGNFQNATAKNFEATNASIENLEADKADIEFLKANYAEIKDLNATNANVQNLTAEYGSFKNLTTKELEAVDAEIKNLDTEKLDASAANIKYAAIDFANITEAAIKKVFIDYGIIDEFVASSGTVVKELIGVTIKGDLIEANTLKADSLIVKGDDGLYYKLNVEAGVTTSAQVSKEDLQNGLHGSVIIAKSIAAEKIAVDDLVAFGATIAGFNIKKDKNGLGRLYSLTKESLSNGTAGIYMDHNGQFALGDSDHYLTFYKDTDGSYKLVLCADSVLFGSGKKNIEDVDTTASSALEGVGTVTENLNQAVSDVTVDIAVKDTKNSSKLEQLRALLSQVVTGENGVSLMVETPESYTRTSTTLTDVSGTLIEGAKTTTGEDVYLATDSAHAGLYYVIDGTKIYQVTYTPPICTFNISDLEKALENANDEISNLTGQVNDIDSAVTDIRKASDNMSADLLTLLSQVHTVDNTVVDIQKEVDKLGIIGGYVYVDQNFEIESGDTVPAIILGESDSEFKVVITNKQIAFMEGSAVPAYISGQTLIAQNVEVKQKLTQGSFSWVSHGGNLGLVWTDKTTPKITGNTNAESGTYNCVLTDQVLGQTSTEDKGYIGTPGYLYLRVHCYGSSTPAVPVIDVRMGGELIYKSVNASRFEDLKAYYELNIPLITGDIEYRIYYK